jgi:DnaK suppressor protein
MDREKMLKYRQKLLEMKKQILDRYLKQEETMKTLTEQGISIPEDLDDYAYIDYTEIVLGELEDVEIELLKAIDEALERMKEGTYGICEVCGKEIEEERLEAVPYTTLCAEHAAEAEKNVDFIDRRYKEYFDRITPREKPATPEEHEL